MSTTPTPTTDLGTPANSSAMGVLREFNNFRVYSTVGV